jgi:hypothetical protein
MSLGNPSNFSNISNKSLSVKSDPLAFLEDYVAAPEVAPPVTVTG